MEAAMNKEVWVYRNLKHGRKARRLYSVMQNGKVLRTVHRLLLVDVRFVVREGGRQRVLREGRKNVHAFVVGRIASSVYGIDKNGKNLPVTVVYNPHNDAHFYGFGKPLSGARAVLLNEHGMTAAYTSA